MRTYNKIVYILFQLTALPAIAQQDALFTQYMYNKLEINPGYAGSHEVFATDLITRFQWVGIEGAPRTFCFSAHTSLRNPHIGLGIYAYQDEIGPSVDYNIMGSFAYRIIFPSSRLCFGISGGIKYYDIDWSQLNPKDAGDVELISQVRNRAVPDADFGIYYYGKWFYAGVSSKHLLQNQMLVSSAPPDDKSSFTKLLRNLYGIAGFSIPFGDNFVFLPSGLIKYVQNAPVQFDLTASFLLFNVFTFGASYRTANAMGMIVEVNAGKGFTIGYSYDIWFNSLKAYNQGSHEIRLGYEFDLFNKERMLTPRYF